MASFTKTVRKVTYTPNDSADLVTGVVTSVSPLKIGVGNVELTSTFLILSPFCIRQVVSLPHSHTYNEDGGTYDTSTELQTVELWRGLIVGDTVWMLKCNNSQTYYVLQRKQGVLI